MSKYSYLFAASSQGSLVEFEIKKAKPRKRLELADPCFLTYQRLRPIGSSEINFGILACPFQTKAGDLIV